MSWEGASVPGRHLFGVAFVPPSKECVWERGDLATSGVAVMLSVGTQSHTRTRRGAAARASRRENY